MSKLDKFVEALAKEIDNDECAEKLYEMLDKQHEAFARVFYETLCDNIEEYLCNE